MYSHFTSKIMLGYFFKVLLKEATARSNIPISCKTFAEVPQDTCLRRLVTPLQCKVKVGRLAKKVWKWFDEPQGKQWDLQYHFTGRDTVVLSQMLQGFNFFEAGRRQSDIMADCARTSSVMNLSCWFGYEPCSYTPSKILTSLKGL